MPESKTRFLVLALAALNAGVYCCSLPLWEGFDEPFHYGYVQTIAFERRLPVFGRTTVSAEIHRSFLTAPLSTMPSAEIPGSISMSAYMQLSRESRDRLRLALDHLSPDLQRQPSGIRNYESQQAPLAYIVLAPFDLLLSRLSLPARILWLRLLGALGATALIYAALVKLGHLVSLEKSLEPAVLACVFASQMLWASVAHVGNDWLAIPLTLCFLTWMAAAAKDHRSRDLLMASVILTAGLWTKAYFLAFTPVFAAFIVFKAKRNGLRSALLPLALPMIAGCPWYVRNFLIYGNFSGTQEADSGIGPRQALRALPHLPWLVSIPEFLRSSLWTGNWMFYSMSIRLLKFELALLGVALVLYMVRSSRIARQERWVIAGCACLLAGMVYQTCVTWLSTGGASRFAEPWYWQGAVPCVWILAFLGIERWPVPGRICATLLCLVSAWVAALTYVAKLIPLYAGGSGHATIQTVAAWWLHDAARKDLDPVALAPATVIYAMLAIFLLLLAWVTAAVTGRVWRPLPSAESIRPHDR